MTNEKAKAFLNEAYSLEDRQSMQRFYEHWADDYDEQMEAGLRYVSPMTISNSLACHLPPENVDTVVDIGCGTGLVARSLGALGYKQIDGIDLSQAMLEVARRGGCYNELIEADLTTVLPIPDKHYHGAICAGTFTHNHVGPAALDEIARIVKAGGVLAFTVHMDLWHRDGFSDKLNQMVRVGTLLELERVAGPYYESGQDEGWFCVYRKL